MTNMSYEAVYTALEEQEHLLEVFPYPGRDNRTTALLEARRAMIQERITKLKSQIEEMKKVNSENQLNKKLEQLKTEIKAVHYERLSKLPELRNRQLEFISKGPQYMGPFTRTDWEPRICGDRCVRRDKYEYNAESPDGFRAESVEYIGSEIVELPAGTYWGLPGEDTWYFFSEGGEENRVYPYCTLVSRDPSKPWESDLYQAQLQKAMWETELKVLQEQLSCSYLPGLRGTCVVLGGCSSPVQERLLKFVQVMHELNKVQGKVGPYSPPPTEVPEQVMDQLNQELGLV